MPRRRSVLLLLLFAPGVLIAQKPLPPGPPWIRVTSEEAASHLVKKADPIYPQFAEAAGIQGVVRFRVDIYADGRIHGFFFPAGGPPALVEAAQNALAGYLYKPFEKGGSPANADTIVEVPFKLPAGVAAHDYPLPALTFNSFFSPSAMTGKTVSFSSLSARMQTWLRSTLKAEYKDSFGAFELDSRIAQAIDSMQVDLIPGHGAKSRVYVFQPGALGGAHNRPALLVEEGAGDIDLIADESMNGYFLRPRPGSAYPDVFFSAHEGMMDLDFVGFAYIGGQWGPLYCGNLKANNELGAPVVRACEPPPGI